MRRTHFIHPKEISNMQESTPRRMRALSARLLAAALLLLFALSPAASLTSRAQSTAATATTTATAGATAQARTPIQTVGEFYKALRERRFREAFALSIYQPALEGLSAG
jgi:hypothetical protein